MKAVLLLLASATMALAAPAKDEIAAMPGWSGALPSKQYSGFIAVDDGPGGQHIMMHYNFIESRSSPSKDPVILWQQGGPGSSGFGFGYMTELGPFHLSASSMSGGPSAVPKLHANPDAWDKQGNVLILEHPPGTGYSYCHDGNNKPVMCLWNDDTQAEAFLQELQGFFKLFPEFSGRELFITGESYAGLLVPNLMNQILLKEAEKELNVMGVALGNGCTGQPGMSSENPGRCNLGGQFDQQHNVDLFYGHGMVPKKMYNEVYKQCNFTCGPEIKACDGPYSSQCSKLISQMSDKLGEYNIYNIYDTCGSGNMSAPAALNLFGAAPSAAAAAEQYTDSSYGTMAQHTVRLARHELELRAGVSGGPPFSYPCGTGGAVNAWMNNEEVRKAIHMPSKKFYNTSWPCRGMQYQGYTHASIDLWPTLIKHFRVVIYNGDVDACVPYNGNEDWTAGLGLAEVESWRPWLVDEVPAGYVTTYAVPGQLSGANFTFLTIKDAGHMVPGYQPQRATAMLKRFLAGGPY